MDFRTAVQTWKWGDSLPRPDRCLSTKHRIPRTMSAQINARRKMDLITIFPDLDKKYPSSE